MSTTVKTATHAYIAREKCCGAVSAATVEGFDGVDQDVAGWIRDGRIVERVTREEARRLMSETSYPCGCTDWDSTVRKMTYRELTDELQNHPVRVRSVGYLDALHAERDRRDTEKRLVAFKDGALPAGAQETGPDSPVSAS